MLCNQQWHQLWYIIVAFTRLRSAWLGCSTDLLSPTKSPWDTIPFGSKTRKFNDVPVIAEAWTQSCTTHRRLFRFTGWMVSFALRDIFGCQYDHCDRWVWRVVEHNIELFEKKSTTCRIDNNRNNNGYERHQYKTSEEETIANTTTGSLLIAYGKFVHK